MTDLKRGDRILIDGAELATVHAVRTPAEMRDRVPELREIFDSAEDSGADHTAILKLEGTPAEEPPTCVIIHTASGWETVDGVHIDVQPFSPRN